MTRAEADDPVPLPVVWMHVVRCDRNCASACGRTSTTTSAFTTSAGIASARYSRSRPTPNCRPSRAPMLLQRAKGVAVQRGCVIEASCTLSRRFSPQCSPSIGTAFTFAGLHTSPGFGNSRGASGHSCISRQRGRAGRRPREALGRRLRQPPPSGHPSRLERGSEV